MPRIADNIRQGLERLHEFEHQYNRPENAVTLLAVSKKQPTSAIREAYEAGIRHFGENYLQEAIAKMQELDDLDIVWHYIGPIQSNKTRGIAEHFHWVHSVDRFKIAQRLSEQRDPQKDPLNVCVQVNISDEASKSGVNAADATDLCTRIDTLPNLRLRGLMTLPVPEIDATKQRAEFARMKTLFDANRNLSADFDTLSMGMSQDYEAAIAEGSTVVRIGTALFGPRR